VKGDPYRIVTFGYLGPNRQLDILLRALADLPERDQFRLDVYGQLWDSSYVQSLIESFRLERLVQLHGFVSEAELDDALSSAHLAINLRYPSMGEASGSQLRIWDHALPSLVTHVGWYADLPEDMVVFVRPGREIKDIQKHLKAFLSNPASFAKMGENGRRVLEERHGPQLYAQAIVDFVANTQRFRSHAVAYKLAERVGAEMSLWTGIDTPQEVYRRAAEEICALVL
jgi:glycosyltransferase involved in cell wall biosynthesis